MKRIATAAALALGVSLVAINGASAAPLTGELWLVTDAQAQDAGTVPSGPADATFNPGVINYQSDVTGYTIGAFLNNPTFSNESANFINAGGANDSADDIFLRITGTIGLLNGDNSFVLGHDDGAVLTI